MLQGEVIKDGWKSEEVKGALDLCLACKGCKGECPVSVDMATYKAEFLSHYYEGRLRPRHAYAFGYIDRFARLASIAPGVVNFFTQTAGLATIAKSVAAMPQQRKIPAFTSRSFSSWFHRRQRQSAEANGKQQVVLWTQLLVDGLHETVNVWVIRNNDKLTVMMTNQALPGHSIETERISMRLLNASEPHAAWIERVDEDHANPRKVWREIGAPDYLSDDEAERLMASSELIRKQQ